MRYNTDYIAFVNRQGAVTASELAEKFGIKRKSAASWLSKNTRAGYLVRTKRRKDYKDYHKPEEYEYRLGSMEKLERIAAAFF